MVAVAIIYFRSFHACYVALGGCIAAIVAKILKLIIRQPRPAPSPDAVLPQAKGYGMPSSHSQVVAFFGVYLQTVMLYEVQLAPLTFALFVILNGFCCSVFLSRVRLGNHSPSQVAVGEVLGCLIAIIWYRLWVKIVAPWLHIYGHETIQKVFLYFHLNPSLIEHIYLH
jgi:dolichyldiphosphatase